MNTRHLVACLVAVLSSAGLSVAQTTWHIDSSAAAPGDGSLATPYASIQYAFDQPGTLDGDTLLLAPGEYIESLQIRGKSCSIVGAEGAMETILQPSEAGHVIAFGGGLFSELRGVTVTGAFGSDQVLGAGLVPSAGVLVDEFGGVEIENCVLRDNVGAGVYGSYNQCITYCTFVGNGVGFTNVGFSIPAGVLSCCVFSGNTEDLDPMLIRGFSFVDCNNFSPVFWDAANHDYHLRQPAPPTCTVLSCTDVGAFPFDPDYLPDSYPSYCTGTGEQAPGCTSCPCSNDDMGGSGGCVNESGAGSRLFAVGAALVSADSLRFELRDMPAMTSGTLFSGANRLPANPMNPCFALSTGVTNLGDGLRCMGGNALRHGTRFSDANGAIGETNNAWGPPNGPPLGLIASSGFVAGQTRHFQVIHRDAATSGCGTGLNSTQGVTVTFAP